MLFTIRRRSNQNGDSIYQAWPNDLPDNAQVPHWLTFDKCSPAIRTAILRSEEIVDDFESKGDADEATSSLQGAADLDERMQRHHLVLPVDIVDETR